MYYHIQDKILGKGSYGKVYLAIDNHQKKVAIKCCPIYKNEGIPNLFEASLMKTIEHPNINSAIDVFSSFEYIYIIQNLAVNDLYQYTSIYSNYSYQFNIKELKHVFFSILQGVCVLHSQNIIHGDIKASNILLFEDGSIKLTDFTLSTKIYDKLNHTVCTLTHRPLECLLKQEWDLSLDIWSLGCTFFEIVYGELLFKNQVFDKSIYPKDQLKKIITNKYIHSILDWSNFTNQNININVDKIDYISIQLPKRFNDEELKEINEIICKLLKIDIELRPTIYDILKYDLFKDLLPENPKCIINKSNYLTYSEHARIIRYIQQITNDVNIQELAFLIYTKIDLNMLSEYNKTVGATWIANKILNNKVELNIPIALLDKIVQIEHDIVHHLHFRLHL